MGFANFQRVCEFSRRLQERIQLASLEPVGLMKQLGLFEWDV